MENLITSIYILLGAGVLLAALKSILVRWLRNHPSADAFINDRSANHYVYSKRARSMTRSEADLYQLLMHNFAEKYNIFPQQHLSVFLNHTLAGQNWQGALSHIQRKSVDFLLCSKMDMRPLLAIELDDPSHEREDRRERDDVVEQICEQAKMPLLRLSDVYHRTPESIVSEVSETLAGKYVAGSFKNN
jgi:hypothetical protein